MSNVPAYTPPPARQALSPNLIADTRAVYDQVGALTEFANTLNPDDGGTDADALPAPLVGPVRVVSAPFLLSIPNYLAFANANDHAPVRKEYLVGYVAQQLQADEFEVFVRDPNKAVALAAAGTTEVTETNDYWYGRVLYDRINYSGITYRWECAPVSDANGAEVWCWFRNKVQ